MCVGSGGVTGLFQVKVSLLFKPKLLLRYMVLSVSVSVDMESPLHPDVSVLQSYPLVLQYKGKRFEMDDFGIWHPFGTISKVTPALQTFLTKERGKL